MTIPIPGTFLNGIWGEGLEHRVSPASTEAPEDPPEIPSRYPQDPPKITPRSPQDHPKLQGRDVSGLGLQQGHDEGSKDPNTLNDRDNNPNVPEAETWP